VILGLPLQPGDEVVTTTQDYWRFINALKQREVRDGIVLKQIPIPVPARDTAEVVARFEAAVTPRTRVLLLCHIINLTGQILPVRDVAAMARRHGVTVLVDGAHSFAHWPFDVQDLGADAYGTSLHKWLGAPHGTGMLWVRRERIPDFWPLFPAPLELAGDIRKFESLGTLPAAPVLAIAEALAFWHSIGAERKEARLRYLRDRWAEPLASDGRYRFHTAFDPAFSCALAMADVEGVEPVDVQTRLWEENRILVRAIRHPEFQGVRVTPNVYTTLDELDRFVEAMRRIANAA
jgi:selenocysteine lyase/cysteine desulfurase